MAVVFRIVTGTMGGGKTLYTVEEAIAAFKDGAVVMSNIDWREEVLKEKGWDKLHRRLPDDPKLWPSVMVRGTEDKPNLLIVDESAMIFHTWDVQESKKRDRDLFDVLVMTRKLGISCYFITQSLENLSSPIRRIANYIMHCVAVKHLPMVGPVAKHFFQFLRVTKTANKGAPLWTEWKRFNPEAGAVYKTDALRGKAAEITAESTRNTTTEQGIAPWIKWTTTILVILIVWAIYHYGWEVPKKIKDGIAGLEGEKPKEEKVLNEKGKAKVTKEELVTQTRPRLHPFGEPSGIKMREIEWDEQDERIKLSVYNGPNGRTFLAMGGERFYVGAHIEGDTIAEMIEYSGNTFCISRTGRVFYIRARTYREKREQQEYYAILADVAKAQVGTTPPPPQTPPPPLQ